MSGVINTVALTFLVDFFYLLGYVTVVMFECLVATCPYIHKIRSKTIITKYTSRLFISFMLIRSLTNTSIEYVPATGTTKAVRVRVWCTVSNYSHVVRLICVFDSVFLNDTLRIFVLKFGNN